MAAANPRLVAVQIMARVLGQGESLSALLPRLHESLPRAQDQSLCKAMVFGLCRYSGYLTVWIDARLKKPFKKKDIDLYILLLLGAYQMACMRVPDHAAISESVNLTRQLGKDWASGLCNAVLRNFQGAKNQWQEDLLKVEPALPPWLLQRVQQDWPEDWRAIAKACMESPPMWIRVNSARESRANYQKRLQQIGMNATEGMAAEDALLLDSAVDVSQLPLFAEGLVSVQDQAAQLAAELLDLQAGISVLDVCAAPGGKSMHMLEKAEGSIALTALDIDAKRMQRVFENLQRGGLSADLVVADATDPQSWWQGQPFDRILLDAPCSATGVIRRHPDIRLLRKPADIPALVALQAKLLTTIWPLLAVGGMLVYSTCSILKQENEDQINAFLATTEDAKELLIQKSWGRSVSVGRQILPGEDQMDGFYYARLVKH